LPGHFAVAYNSIAPKPHAFRCSVTATGTATIYQHMYRSFGLQENPFHVSPDPRFLFSGAAYETALAELMFGIESHRGLLVVTGEAGTGKTTLMRHFLQWLKDRQFSSSYIFHSHLDPTGLLEFILRDFGVPVLESTKKSDLLAALHRWLHLRQAEGDSPVIVIDEAQALSLRTLSELNLLLNLENVRGKLVQIVLAGQPELEEKLRRPESRAVRQRIMVRCRLPLLSLEETEEYIESRLRGAGGAVGSGAKVFPLGTVQTVYSYARGVPRIVNLLCEQALIGAYADRQTVVFPQNVRRAAAEFDLVGAPYAVQQPQVALPAASGTTLPQALPVEKVELVSSAATSEAPAAEQKVEVAAASIVGTPAEPVFEAPLLTAQPRPAAPLVAEAVIAEAPVVAVREEAARQRQPALLSEDRLPELAHAWRKRQTPNAFRMYWRDVVESFVRDWRQFFVSLSPQAATFPRFTVPRSESIRRGVIEPIREWLNRPLSRRSTRFSSKQDQDK